MCCHRPTELTASPTLTTTPAHAISLFFPPVAQGDNNRVDDRGLYAPGQQWLNREDILGRASGTSEFVCVYTA